MRYLVVVVAALLWLNSCSEKQAPNTTEQKTSVATGAESGDAVKVIAKGTGYDIEKNLVRGKVTVFKFYADW